MVVQAERQIASSELTKRQSSEDFRAGDDLGTDGYRLFEPGGRHCHCGRDVELAEAAGRQKDVARQPFGVLRRQEHRHGRNIRRLAQSSKRRLDQ